MVTMSAQAYAILDPSQVLCAAAATTTTSTARK
jgi:hypothetical protein